MKLQNSEILNEYSFENAVIYYFKHHHKIFEIYSKEPTQSQNRVY